MPVLPVGTVTFLFTDIEGSTSRWEHQRAAMQTALARHDAILRHAIEAHGGVVFKTVGDAFYAAFATAPDALAAALAAQRVLYAEDWGAFEPLHVRMALHTGAVEMRDGDYFGPPLNRVARLLAAGHGGQILLSAVTQELVRDDLPPSTELRDLGAHRLKDLIRPEHVFQLVTPKLPADFPPLKTLDAHPTNLPAQPTPLIGREREIATASALLRRAAVHLVTLTGPGGTGKTRLGVQVAAELLDEFADGVFFVNLAPLSDPALVASTIAQTLGVTEAGGQSLEETLKSYLHDKQLLLLLDNFEQILQAVPLVAELLAAAPQVKMVVTSRAVLHLRGEHEFPVPPLALPDLRRPPLLERLTQYEAVRLFIERAQAVKPDFQVTNANAPAVAEICVRLDGLPLAIELAAARSKMLPPDALLQRLSSRLKLLTGGPIDLPARQQTLRNTIEWSYSLLDPAEQTLFARQAVFVGGRTLEAIEAVCNAEGDLPIDPFDGVASLLDKSLLRQVEGPDGEPRFIMLETLHEYARERLQATGEAETLQRRHAEYFLALVEAADAKLQGTEQGDWLQRLEAEFDNVRATLQWSLDRNEAELGLRLCVALTKFWSIHSHFSEGRRWLGAVLARSDNVSPSIRGRALQRAGILADMQGDYAQAAAFFEQSLVLFRQMEDVQGIAGTLGSLGIVAINRGDYTRAAAFLEESLTYQRKLGDKLRIAHAIHNLGVVALYVGDFDAAEARYQEALAMYRALEDNWYAASSLNNLGEVLLFRGDYAAAIPLLDESLSLYREFDDTQGIAGTLGNLAQAALEQGDSHQAAVSYKQSLKLSGELEDRQMIAMCLTGLAKVAGTQGYPIRAARLFGAAEVLRQAIDAALPPTYRTHYERYLIVARTQLDETAWAAAWAEGRTMSLEQAIAYALENDSQS